MGIADKVNLDQGLLLALHLVLFEIDTRQVLQKSQGFGVLAAPGV